MIPITKFILKKCLIPVQYFKFKVISWLTHDDMEFELELKGPFWVEISLMHIIIVVVVVVV